MFIRVPLRIGYDGQMDRTGLAAVPQSRNASTNSQGCALPVRFLALFPTAKMAGTNVPAIFVGGVPATEIGYLKDIYF